VKVRDVIREVEADGWVLVATRGSHHQYEHPTKKGKVTIAGHPGDDVHPKTLKSIFDQAQIRKGQ
jgi:predicted RNA binding protein YcfA (HicA-like mRNA interferase family)